MSKTCPSYECLPGAELIGIAGADGVVHFVDPIRVDKNFVTTAREQKRQPEVRFRFSGRCVEKNCAQWKGDKCGLPDRVNSLSGDFANHKKCPIKSSCRWRAQGGDKICLICPGLVRGSDYIKEEIT